MSPLPKGRTNNPHGRPKLEHPRVMFTARVAPETAETIIAEAQRLDLSRGAFIDELVAVHVRRRKRNS